MKKYFETHCRIEYICLVLAQLTTDHLRYSSLQIIQKFVDISNSFFVAEIFAHLNAYDTQADKQVFEPQKVEIMILFCRPPSIPGTKSGNKGFVQNINLIQILEVNMYFTYYCGGSVALLRLISIELAMKSQIWP